LGATNSANAYAFGQRYQNCNQWLAWLAGLLPWLHADDHPPHNREGAQFQVSMPAYIDAFVRQHWPDSTRIELCYNRQHIVVRRGWEPKVDDCTPGA